MFLKKRILSFGLVLCLVTSGVFLPVKKARADLFGGDVVVLTQILFQTIQQLMQLKSMYDNARSQYDFIKNLNGGIDHALGNLNTSFKNFDPKSYDEWYSVQQGLKKIEDIYGKAPDSKNKKSQEMGDLVISEALTLNQNIFDKANYISGVGESIKARANQASPKGAQKVTAESMGVVVQVLNESLKAQGQQLKLSAQNLALKNSEDKKETALFLSSTKELKKKMESHKSSFKVPRF